MKALNSIVPVCLCLVFAGSFVTALQAQDGEQTTQDVQDVHKIVADSVVSINISDCTVEEYIRSLQEKVRFNCVVQESARPFRLPDIKLHNVSLKSALDAMVFASDEAIHYNVNNHYVQIQFMDEPDEVVAFNLRHLMADESEMETLVKAIEFGIELQGVAPNRLMTKLHKESGMFFAKGKPEPIALVGQILMEYTGVRSRRHPPGSGLLGPGGGGGTDNFH